MPSRPPNSQYCSARAVAFLASDDSTYITGQVIYVDGGYSAGKLSVHD